jgi:hypothetical protein
METIQLDDSEHIERQARAAFVIKDHIIVTTMETRIAIRQILSRSQGEAAEAANTDHQRQVLIKQGDGRYLYMRAITNEEIQEVLSDLPTFLTTDFDWEALKGQMSMLLTAEIIEENYSQYLKQNEDLGSMGFEDKVSFASCLRDSQSPFTIMMFIVRYRF